MNDIESKHDLKARTKQFAIRTIRLCERLPSKPSARIIANQLLRSATSVGANYRAVCRARSDADFVSKMGVVLEEADESAYWLELLAESGLIPPEPPCSAATGGRRTNRNLRRVANNGAGQKQECWRVVQFILNS